MEEKVLLYWSLIPAAGFQILKEKIKFCSNNQWYLNALWRSNGYWSLCSRLEILEFAAYGFQLKCLKRCQFQSCKRKPNYVILEPFWLSTGQRSRFWVWCSEFKTCLIRHFYVVLKRAKINQKGHVWPKKIHTHKPSEENVVYHLLMRFMSTSLAIIIIIIITWMCAL